VPSVAPRKSDCVTRLSRSAGGQAELAQFQQRMAGAVVAERIEIGDEVAQFAVGVDQVLYFDAGGGVGGLGPSAGRRQRRPMPPPLAAGGFESGEEGLPMRLEILRL
jgi:hypothetical protein